MHRVWRAHTTYRTHHRTSARRAARPNNPRRRAANLLYSLTPPARAAAVAGRTTPDHLVLPVPPLVDGRELSDADLDGVSGGGALANFFGSLFGAARAAFNQIFYRKVDIAGAVAQHNADAQAAQGG